MVKKIIFVFVLLVFLASVVLADFNEIKEDFRAKFESYTKTHQEYQSAKAKYFQFRTLLAETEAFAAFKTILAQRASLLESYFNLLAEKLNETPAVSPTTRNNLTSEINSTRAYLADFETRANNAQNIAQAQNLTAEFEEKKEEWQNSSTKIAGIIFISNLSNIAAKANQLIGKTEEALKEKQTLTDLNLREENIGNAREKLGKAATAIKEAEDAFLTITPQTRKIEIFRAKQTGENKAESAKSLLTEAVGAITNAARGF